MDASLVLSYLLAFSVLQLCGHLVSRVISPTLSHRDLRRVRLFSTGLAVVFALMTLNVLVGVAAMCLLSWGTRRWHTRVLGVGKS